jgi:hypothetical protein
MTKIERLRQLYTRNQEMIAESSQQRDQELVRLLGSAERLAGLTRHMEERRQQDEEIRRRWLEAARRAKELGRQEEEEEEEETPF